MVSLGYILTLFLCNALKWIFSFVRRWLWSCFHILIKSACTGFLWITEIIVKWQNSHMLFYIAHLCTCAIKVCAEDSVKSYFVENEIIKSVSCGSHNRICNYNYWSIRSQFSGLQGMRTAKKKGGNMKRYQKALNWGIYFQGMYLWQIQKLSSLWWYCGINLYRSYHPLFRQKIMAQRQKEHNS